MVTEFIPYELEVKLKKLGCNKEFSNGNHIGILWQQAFDWFRTEHNLHALNSPVLNQEWTVVIDNTLNAHQVHWDKKPNYEEAKLECLKKLIELIENK